MPTPASVDVARLASGVGLVIAAGAVLVAAGLLLRRQAGRGRRRAREAEKSRGRPSVTAPPLVPTDAEEERRPAARTATAAFPVSAVRARDTATMFGPPISPFAATLDRSRRLVAAEQRVAGELAELPAGCWIVERYVLVGARRLPFLVVGAGGVFALAATDGAWTIRDFDVLCRLGEQLGGELPDRPGPVHAAVCLAFDEMAPRRWHGGTEMHGRGGWVLGIDWLKTWLYSHDPGDGIEVEALRRLDTSAGPWWTRRLTARLPAKGNVG